MSDFPESTVNTEVIKIIRDNQVILDFWSKSPAYLESIAWVPKQDLTLRWSSFYSDIPSAGNSSGFSVQVKYSQDSSHYSRILSYDMLPGSTASDQFRKHHMMIPIPAGSNCLVNINNSMGITTSVTAMLIFEYTENKQVYEIKPGCGIVNWVLGKCD